MPFFSFRPKSPVPFRTEDGQRHLNAYVNGPYENIEGFAELRNLMPRCAECRRKSLHAPCEAIGHKIPYGKERRNSVPQEHVLAYEDALRPQFALWCAGYIHHPMDKNETIVNAGAGNNMTQRVDYKITGVSGNVLTFYGLNPKYLAIGYSQVNPDWPGEGGYFDFDSFVVSLFLGAMVVFDSPSVLRNSLEPYIKKINMPASNDVNVTFTVEVSCNVSYAMTHYDAGLATGADIFKARVYFYALQPERYPNLQTGRDDQFSFKTKRYTRTALTDHPIVPLLDNANGDTRVLYPFMLPAGTAFQVLGRKSDNTLVYMSDAWITARLTTVQTGSNQWESSIDLTDALTEVSLADCDLFQISYRPQAVSTDTFLMQFSGSCSRAWFDRTGSYRHGDTHRCARIESTGFDDFEDRCWQPVGKTGTGCDGFGLGDETASVGAGGGLVADIRKASYWAPLFVRANWVLEQAMASVETTRNLNLTLPSGGGTSLMSLCGSWANQVADGRFPRRTQWFGPVFGVRTTGSDAEGATQTITTGLYFATGNHNMGTVGRPGILNQKVPGWSARKNGLGETMSTVRSRMPRHGHGRVHLYTFEFSGGGLHRQIQLRDNQQLFATAIDLDALGVIDALNDEMQARFS